jgi:transposase-like protein
MGSMLSVTAGPFRQAKPGVSSQISYTVSRTDLPRVAALGADSGISNSEVSRVCADLDVEVAAFRDGSLGEQEFPYLFLDATYGKACIGGDRRGRGSRVTAQAIVVATGVSADGRREVLGCDSATANQARSGPNSCAS